MKNATGRFMQKAGIRDAEGAQRSYAVIMAAMVMALLLSFSAPVKAAAPTDCVDPTLQTNLVQGTAAYTNAAIINTRTVFEASPRSDIRNTQCLNGGFFNYFDIIRSLLAGINAMVVMINTLVTTILRMVCSYINNAITNLINSALSLLCIPTLPGLNFGLNLGGFPFGRSSCSGTPLLTYGSGGLGFNIGGSAPGFMNMSRGIPGSGGSFRF